MNKLLVFFGVISVLIGGGFVLNDLAPGSVDFLPSFLFSSIVLSLVIISTGFIRFNKIIGIGIFIIGGVSLLSDLNIIPLRIIATSFLPWFLIIIGIRFLVIGFLSEGNTA